MRIGLASQYEFADRYVSSGYERPATPQSDEDSPQGPPEFLSKPRDLSDDDEDFSEQQVSRMRPSYENRVERLLNENEDLQIIIIDAGKSHESGGSYIAYTIRTGVCNPRGIIIALLTVDRMLKCEGDIRNSILCEQLSSIYTPP